MNQQARRPRFESNEYVRSHGKAPRGFGCWAFFFDQDPVAWFAGQACSFSVAKDRAADEARARGARVAKVAP